MTLHELTEKIAGKKQDGLYLIGARPTMGKTSIAMGMALELASSGKKVNFLSCSEKPAFMTQHLEFINKGGLSEAQKQNIKSSDPAAFSAEDIAALCDNQPDAVFIDTLQELKGYAEDSAALQKKLKDISFSLECPVIVISQLTDKIDKRLFSHKPRVKDLADSGIDAALYDDVVLFYRDSRYNANASREKCCIIFKGGEESCTWSDTTNCIK